MIVELTNLSQGKVGTIKEFRGGQEFIKKAEAIGLRVGKKVSIISMQPFHGPVIVEVDNTTIALGRGMAQKILVEI